MSTKYSNEQEVINLYTQEKYTLRRIGKHLGISHSTAKRILLDNNIEITREERNRIPMTEEHKRKLSESAIGKTAWNKGKKAKESWRRKNIIGRIALDITIDDISKYEDYGKLRLLMSFLSRNRKHFGDREKFLGFLDKFYFDATFNDLYEKWVCNNKNMLYMPSLDHKRSRSNGGGWELDNLEYITLFENKAKGRMNKEEWDKFKLETNTKSDLFI